MGLLGAMMLLGLVSEVDAASATERLGTLFYSAQERAAIARERQGEVYTEAGALMNLGGIVKRERGKSTVWINQQAVAEGQSLPPSTPTAITAAGVTLGGERVRVGETLDLTTRQRTDIVSPGSVTSRGQK